MGSCCHGPWLWCNRLACPERSRPALSWGCWEQTTLCPGLHVAASPWRVPACQGGSGGKRLSRQPHLQPPPGAPVQGGSAARSLPAAPCQLGPTQQARLAGWLPFRGESSCLGSVGWGWAGFRAKRHGRALVLIVALIVLGGLTAWTSRALCLGCSHAGLTIRHRPRVSLRWDRLVLLLQRPRPGASTVSTGQPSWLLSDPSSQRPPGLFCTAQAPLPPRSNPPRPRPLLLAAWQLLGD